MTKRTLPNGEVTTALVEAGVYPLDLRIAAGLWLAGETELSFMKREEHLRIIPFHTVVGIRNHIRSMELGIYKIDNRLIELASEIFPIG